MHTLTKAFWVPKRGNAPEEYEDAYWADADDPAAATFRVAVADGATEASFSRQWAKALVRSFGDRKLRIDHLAEDIAELRSGWQRALAQHLGNRPMPWFAEQKASFGAFAALVGLELHCRVDPATAPWWDAVAVGDSNLCAVRGGSLLTAFPLTRADQFSGGPFLIGSNVAGADDPLVRRVDRARGELQAGDTFHLMSDALACWFLRAHEQGERPWERFLALPEADAPAAFAGLVDELRDGALLHNDDVTLISIAIMADVPTADAEPDPLCIEADETTPF